MGKIAIVTGDHARYGALERMWTIAFYMAAAPRSCTLVELAALIEWEWSKWSMKTLRRDMGYWVKFGTVEKYRDRLGTIRYKWIGSKKPFFRVGQIYCRGCNEFKDHTQMVVVKGNFLPRCRTCNAVRRAKWYYGHHKEALNKMKEYRIKSILEEQRGKR